MPQASNRKAWLQIVEVVIAGLLIFYYLSYMASAFKYTSSAVDESVRVKKLAEDTIIALDNMPRGATTVLRDDLNKRNHTDLLLMTDYFIRYPYQYGYEINYPNETYVSRGPQKKITESANYIIFDEYEGKPAVYSLRLVVWAVG